MNSPNLSSPNLNWARVLLHTLVEGGAGHACISPGSRSTPLTLAAAELADQSERFTTSVHIDERSAAFFGLGYAKATGLPAILICTSGTAGANYFPAIIEAKQSHIPLLVLTADRPAELRDCGSWQTIDQIKLFGDHVRDFTEVALPEQTPEALRYLQALARRSFGRCLGPKAGPVHLNLPFREPLMGADFDSSSGSGDETQSAREAEDALDWSEGSFASKSVVRSADFGLHARSRGILPPAPKPELIDQIAGLVRAYPRGLILAGRNRYATSEYATALSELASRTGYPILAEPMGGLRFASRPDTADDQSIARSIDQSTDQSIALPLIVSGYAALLRDEAWASAHFPQVILRFGASFTWKHVAMYLRAASESRSGLRQFVLDPQHRWDDPTHAASQMIAADEVAFAEALCDRLKLDTELRAPEISSDAVDNDPRSEWRDRWAEVDRVVEDARTDLLASEASGSAWVYETLMRSLPDNALIYVANSMAVRDLDSFTRTSDKSLRVLCNRGTAGIDGTVSSALGAALGSGRPSILVTGDLAFLHDLNGLGVQGLGLRTNADSEWSSTAPDQSSGLDSDLRQDPDRETDMDQDPARDLNPSPKPMLDLSVVLIDDGGGGIFDHMPIAKADSCLPRQDFQRYFRTKPGADLNAAAKTYGIPMRSTSDDSQLRDALADSIGRPGLEIFHIQIDPAENLEAHCRFWEQVSRGG